MLYSRIAVVAVVVGCASKSPDPVLAKNPLDTIDPAQGFVAAAWTATETALADASRQEISDHNRILFVADPLGVARFAAEAERERTYCKTPPCALDAQLEAAVTSYGQKSTQYTPILVAHHQALAAWAALAAAHQALGIANVLDQAGVLTAAGRDEIAQAASALTAAPDAYGTLDWALVMAATTEDPTIGAEVLGHAPVHVPLPAIEAASRMTVAAVLAEVMRETLPLSPLCCSETLEAPSIGSPAYQVLRRVALLEEWSAIGDGAVELDMYRDALATLALKTLSGAASDVTWSAFQAGGSAYATQLATLVTTIDAAGIIANPDVSVIANTNPYEDLNASRPRPNVANVDAGDLGSRVEGIEPAVQLRTNVAIPHAGGADCYSPSYFDPPPPPDPPRSTDGATELPRAAPIVIEWDVHASSALDHLDLQVWRDAAVDPIAHFIERPSGGMFPSRTIFDPRTMDPGAPSPLPAIAIAAHYTIRVVAVDARGRPSGRQTSAIDVRFQAGGASTHDLAASQVTRVVVRGYDPEDERDISFLGAVRNQLEVRPFTTSTGSYFSFDPTYVLMDAPGASITILNLDTQPHHLRAVFTAPYVVDPDLLDVSIGHVQPLDLGEVLPGGNIAVPPPPGAVDGTRWTLYDLDVPHQAVKVQVVTP